MQTAPDERCQYDSLPRGESFNHFVILSLVLQPGFKAPPCVHQREAMTSQMNAENREE